MPLFAALSLSLLHLTLGAGAAAAAPTAATCAAVTRPAPCGLPTDGAAYCARKGCCWDAALGDNACFYPGGNAVPITDVGIAQACHFDAGYAGTTAEIMTLWWYTHFPRAYALGLALDARGGPERLQFMAQSWIVSLFLDCPPGLAGVRCPTPGERANLTTAIARGYITWHAYPFNGEPELLDAPQFSAALGLTHALDDALGVPRKATMSQRDVPGLTRAVLPLLAAANVSAISLGTNCYSMPPALPRAFVWRDQASGAALPVLLHPYNYGAISYNDSVVVPGLAHALVYAWRGDNAGPPASVQEVLDNFAFVRSQFPGARVYSTTLDAFTARLRAPAVAALLPVATGEIGDTWLHGIAADPHKTAMAGRAQALRSACLASGACSASDPALRNFTRLLLKNNEHTWGKSHLFLNDTMTWSNAALDAAIARGVPGFLDSIASWEEQRVWGLEYALEALRSAGHPLAAGIGEAWADVYPPAPPPAPAGEGWVPFSPSATPAVAISDTLTVGFSAASGGLSFLASGAVVWANGSSGDGSVLFEAEYQTYDNSSINQWLEEYNAVRHGPFGCGYSEWYVLGFGKPNMTAAVPTPARNSVRQSLLGMWRRGASFLVESTFLPATLSTFYGAPQLLRTQFDFPSGSGGGGGGSINVSLSSYGKRATRLPEGLFVRLRPAAALGALGWSVGKLGSAVDVGEVVEGGNQRQHGAVGGVRAAVGGGAAAGAALSLGTPDAPLAVFGQPSIFPTPTERGTVDLAQGVSVLLMDNLCVAGGLVCARDLLCYAPIASLASPFNKLPPSPPLHTRRSIFFYCQVEHQLPLLAALEGRG